MSRNNTIALGFSLDEDFQDHTATIEELIAIGMIEDVEDFDFDADYRDVEDDFGLDIFNYSDDY